MIPVLRFLISDSRSINLQNQQKHRRMKTIYTSGRVRLQFLSITCWKMKLCSQVQMAMIWWLRGLKFNTKGLSDFRLVFADGELFFSVIGVSTIAGSIFFFIFFVFYQRFAVCRGDDNMFMVDSHSFLGFAVWRQCSQLPVEAFGNHCCILRSWYFPVMPFLRMFVLIPFWK